MSHGNKEVYRLEKLTKILNRKFCFQPKYKIGQQVTTLPTECYFVCYRSAIFFRGMDKHSSDEPDVMVLSSQESRNMSNKEAILKVGSFVQTVLDRMVLDAL